MNPFKIQMRSLLHKMKTLVTGEDSVAPEASAPDAAQKSVASSFFADLPIETAEQDRFQRWPFAQRIAQTLAERSEANSLVVAINGPWGDGKTSVLRLMEAELSKHAHVIVAKFNPWRFGTDDELLVAFFETLASALKRSLTTGGEEIGKALRDYAFLLSPIAGDEVARGLGVKLSETSLEDLRSRIEGFLRNNAVRIVMMIDDIDRLDKSEIHAMFKLIKLSAGFENISYVVAFDDEVVASALGERYGEGDLTAGRRFLEKIVQVPLHLPPADEIELRKMTFEGVDAALSQAGIQLNEEQTGAFVRHFVDGIEPVLRSPRQARLYGNALLFALPLLKGEANPVDVMLVEGLRVFHPKLYGYIRENPDKFARQERQANRHENEERVALAEKIESLVMHEEKEVRTQIRDRLIEVLFPRLQNMGYGGDWDVRWSREQRVCSSEYFQRYFSYAIPQRDVSDLDVERFIQYADDSNSEGLEGLWQTSIARSATEQFVRKLRLREEAVNAVAATNIALIVANHSDAVPRQKAMMLSDWGFTQAAILVAHLLRRVPQGERVQTAIRIIEAMTSLPFAFECFRWIRTDDTDPAEEAKRLVSKEDETLLGRLLAQRIQTAASNAPIYRTFGEDAPRLLWLWNKYGSAAEAAAHLVTSFDADKEAVVEFLCTYVGLAWGMESGLAHRGDFNRNDYDAVKVLVAPDEIMQRLQDLYGDALDSSSHRFGDTVPYKNRVANQFAFIHEGVKAELMPEAPPN